MNYEIIQGQQQDPLDVLSYEIEMLNLALSDEFLLQPKINIIDRNVRFESFLLHARNLIDFLEDKGQKDDFSVSDFKDSTQQKISPIKLALDVEIKTKINKHLSHISKKRLTEKFAWDIVSIRNNINAGVETFLKQLNADYFPTIGKLERQDLLDSLK